MDKRIRKQAREYAKALERGAVWAAAMSDAQTRRLWQARKACFELVQKHAELVQMADEGDLA